MANPISNYSDDARDFLTDYKKKIANDDRLEQHQDVVHDYGETYQRAYQLWNTFYAEAYKDLSYYLGNQWSLEELSYLNNQRRSSFTYNKTRPKIDLIHGQWSKNRLSTIVSPVENSSDLTAEIFTDTIQQVMNFSGGHETESQAVRGALTTGVSFVSPWLDYRSDPVNGDIRFHHDAWNAVILDPFLTKRDLSDCTFITRRKFLGRSVVKSLIPGKEDVIDALPWGTRDDKFTYMPYARQWGMQKLMNYNEFWRTKWVDKQVLVDMQTGETVEWKGDKDRLRLMQRLYPQLKVINKPVRTVELGIIVEGELLYYGEDPNGLNDYPFVPYFFIFEPSYDLYEWKIQSAVRPLRDPQTEINKRRSKMVDMVDNQLSTGWKAKTNSVSNPSSLYKTGNGQVIFMKPESQMTDAEKILPVDLPMGLFQIEQEFENDLFEVLGLSREAIGMPDTDKIEVAAVLAKSRELAGWIPLQGFFDGVRESKILLGQKVLKLIQLNYSPEKIKLLTKKEPTPEFYSKTFAKYDVIVEEGINTDTQRQTEFMQRMALKMAGVNITDAEVIETSNIHGKKKIQERMQKEAEAAAQAQQQQMQLAMENQATITKSLDAKSQSDQALAAERINKIGLDAALNEERIARADEDRTAGILNLIKAAQEIKGMSVEELRAKVEILMNLEKDQAEKKEPESA